MVGVAVTVIILISILIMDTLLALFIVLVLQGTGMNPRYANFALATARLGNIFPLSWRVGAVS